MARQKSWNTEEKSSAHVDAQNASLVREYLDWLGGPRGRRGGTVYNYRSVLIHYLAHLGSRSVLTAGLREMETFLGRKRGGRAQGDVAAPATQAKDAAILRAFYRFLTERGRLSRNPAGLLCAPTVRNRNPRPMDDDHWLKLWDSDLTTAQRFAFGLGFYAGLRRRELAELRPEQIDTNRRRLVGFVRKGGGDDVLPYGDLCDILDSHMPHLRAGELHEAVIATLDASHGAFALSMGFAAMHQRVKHELPVGMSDPGMLNKHLARACKVARIPHYTPHQLRHSFVTNLLRAGVPLHLVQRMANHTDPAITSRYVKAGPGELREWMDRAIALPNRHA